MVAGRLCESYYRPAVVVQVGETESRGSCRSIPEFDITAALDLCADLLVRHGGHAPAAGFTVLNENLPKLRERLMEIAADKLAARELRPTLSIDAVVHPEMPTNGWRPICAVWSQRVETTRRYLPRADAYEARRVGQDAGTSLRFEDAHDRRDPFRMKTGLTGLQHMTSRSTGANEWNGREAVSTFGPGFCDQTD